MQQGDAKKMGQLMNASHLSLRDDFEVSSEHLNAIVSCAQKAPGCYGARMTGAGFGGCAVALVAKNKVQEFENFVSTAYYQQTEKQPSLYATKAAECVSAEEL